MKLVVLSHKETWKDCESPTGYSTVGGFPIQMKAISKLFDQTHLLVPIKRTPLPQGAQALVGQNLSVSPLTEPKGKDLYRTFNLLPWLIHNLPFLWREVRQADAIHTPIPGDIGSIGILLALLQKKPLFIRHCGNWYKPYSRKDKLMRIVLEKISGGRNVVMATGGGLENPSKRNSSISWIFSTSLSKAEMASVQPKQPWCSGEKLNLISVGRLTYEKNFQAVIRSLPRIIAIYPNIKFHLAGDGPYMQDLQKLVTDLALDEFTTFYGNVNHNAVKSILEKGNIFIFPSTSEGFPKAVLEALSYYLPVIASDVSVLPLLLVNGAGIVLPHPDAESISTAVLDLINNEQKLKEMSLKARDVSQEFTIERWQETISDRLFKCWE